MRSTAATWVVVVALMTIGSAQVRRLPTVPQQRNNLEIRPEQVLLAADRIREDRWYPPASLADAARELSRNADMDLLLFAGSSIFPGLRRVAVREFGRFESVDNAAYIATFLEDEDPAVRIAAADALVQTLVEQPERAVTLAVEPIEFRLLRETDPNVMVALWRNLTELPLPQDRSIALERRLLDELQQGRPLRVEAGKILVDLLWNLRGRPALAPTVQALRQWFLLNVLRGDDVRIGTVTLGRLETFFEALQAAKVDDDGILEAAVRSADGAVRLRSVEMHNPHNPGHRDVLERMARGTDMWVKDAAIIRLLANSEVPICDLLPLATRPATRIKVIEALGKLKGAVVGGCANWPADLALFAIAEELREATAPRAWQAPVLALEEVAPRMPLEAAALARLTAVKHHHWMVRAAAARVAAVVKDPDLALQLIDDAHPNVRVDALRTLFTLRHSDAVLYATNALDEKDYHLVRTVAMLLEGAPEPAPLLVALMSAFDRLSKEGKDTSREPRLALLTRMQELGARANDVGPAWAATLHPHLQDFDPVIAQAVAQVIFTLTGTMPEARPKYRPAEQPTEGELRTTPPCVRFEFDDADPWELTLDRERAPLASARFWRLSAQGYYTGSYVTDSDELVAHVGSPGANDYVSAHRYIRDEVGSPLRAGSVVMQGHGRDTLDGRLQLLRKPHRETNRRVTVLGRVPDVFDLRSPLLRPALAGNRIVSVSRCDHVPGGAQ